MNVNNNESDTEPKMNPARTIRPVTAVVLILLTLPTFANIFTVKDFGAAGDGKTLDTDAVNRAITTAAKNGGGTILFPAGTYLCGSIRLKSHIELRLLAGAKILGAGNNINAYDLPEDPGFELYQDFGHSHFHNSLIWGENLENIAITGPGTIDGGGMTGGLPPDGGGDKAIALKLCRNVSLTNFTIHRGGHFAALLTGCDNVTIDNLLIDTQRDGINIDCCRNVMVSNTMINSDDDGLCLKSSYALGYARATENVTITNCILSGYHEGTVLDGTFKDEGDYHAKRGGIKRISRIKFGTETNGGFKNIAISNCVFDKCWGLALEIVDGGTMEYITVDNITMRDVADTPFFLRLGNRARGPEGTPVGKMRHIRITNVIASVRNNQYASHLTGIPGHPIEDLHLENITVFVPGGEDAGDYESPLAVRENEKGGPGEKMLGKIPAYGFFIRHVKDLYMNNVTVTAKEADTRPGIVFHDVQGLEMNRVQMKNPHSRQNQVQIHDCTFTNAK